ncbi:uncharacterized protein LOC128960452 isoform X2 [Oppia nitens]|uniref:uncharacterized protein LOC128960452 isoform X2 n=1 Tax=Oppia nitens TaxID=1686743 RepID=UPI0023DB5157|nr:uncharacterized protein LOC128960452 isoform X2 [Oppia nitens]
MYRLSCIVVAISVCNRYNYQHRYRQLILVKNRKLIEWLSNQSPIVGLRCAQQMAKKNQPFDQKIDKNINCVESAIEKKCRPFMVTVLKLSISDHLSNTANASGFIVDNKLGLIVTNDHVVEGIDFVTVCLFNETLRYCDVFIDDQNQTIIKGIYGRVVYTAPDRDLALIQLPPIRPNVLPVCEFTTDCQPGDPIVSLSCAAPGRCLTIDGIVQKLDKLLNIDSSNQQIKGYSGGPVVNMLSGQVVGVHKADLLGSSHFSIAIGAKTAMDFINEGTDYLLAKSAEVIAKKHRKPIKRKTLGIVLVDNQIVDITFSSLTIRQNLRVSDRIISYNKMPFTTLEAMSDHIQQLPDNIPQIVLTVYRQSNSQILSNKVQPIIVEQFEC